MKPRQAVFAQVAELRAGYIMMHSRGNPRTMTQREHCTYDDLEADVARELQNAAAAAMTAGVHAWQLMLDPGIGFAKTAADNARLVTSLPGVRSHLQGA
jgi:2-amino-4-hydroxy-6-hydroxymethyldihydropteridine diphosphokinase / dihydropteroate synthase